MARWLRWLTAMSSDSVPAIRMDFLVRRSGAGRAEVHSLELTELGFSLLGSTALSHHSSFTPQLFHPPDSIHWTASIGQHPLDSIPPDPAAHFILRWHAGPHIILDALLESCFDDTGPTDEEASALSAFRARRAHEIRGCGSIYSLHTKC